MQVELGHHHQLVNNSLWSNYCMCYRQHSVSGVILLQHIMLIDVMNVSGFYSEPCMNQNHFHHQIFLVYQLIVLHADL